MIQLKADDLGEIWVHDDGLVEYFVSDDLNEFQQDRLAVMIIGDLRNKTTKTLEVVTPHTRHRFRTDLFDGQYWYENTANTYSGRESRCSTLFPITTPINFSEIETLKFNQEHFFYLKGGIKSCLFSVDWAHTTEACKKHFDSIPKYQSVCNHSTGPQETYVFEGPMEEDMKRAIYKYPLRPNETPPPDRLEFHVTNHLDDLHAAVKAVLGETEYWGKDVIQEAARLIKERHLPRIKGLGLLNVLNDLEKSAYPTDGLNWRELQAVQQKVCALKNRIDKIVDNKRPEALEQQRQEHLKSIDAKRVKHQADVKRELARRTEERRRNEAVPFGHESDED